MNKDYLLRVLIVIVLCLLIYLALKPSGNSDYLNLLKDENKRIGQQIDSLKISLQAKLDSIKIIEKKETIIRNYYNEVIKNIDTLSNSADAIRTVRQLLDSLGPARFD